MRKILVVEDDEMLRESYSIILSTEPYNLFVVSDGDEALKICEDNNFDLILLDLMMPRVDGVSFLKKYKSKVERLPKIILLSNLSSGELLNQALKLGAYKNVLKADLSPKQLISLVKYELEPVVT